MPPRAKKTDPFANTASDEAQTVKPSNTQENTMTDTVPTEVSATFKGDGTFGSPWIVFRAGSPAELNELLDGDSTAGLFERVFEKGGYFAEMFPEKVANTGGGNSGGGGGNTPAPKSAPGGESRQCKHGDMTFRSGVGNNGKTWKAFFCPTPKGTADQCDPEWLR